MIFYVIRVCVLTLVASIVVVGAGICLVGVS